MSKPVEPPKQKDDSEWIPIGKAANEIARKLAEKVHGK